MINKNRITKFPVGRGLAFMSVVALISLSAGIALAGEKVVPPDSSMQAKPVYVDEAEDNAYHAARKEPDPGKRAALMMEFIQKYPESALLEKKDYDLVKPLEEERNTFYAAMREPDFVKRAAMLISFLERYPKSSLAKNVEFEYPKMEQQSSQGKNYGVLESLAEQWIKTHPDRETYGFIIEATYNLQKYEKCARWLEELYKIQPAPALAREVLACYLKTGNAVKQVEWAGTVLKLPEFADDYMLRYNLVMKFSGESNLQKAAEYAQLTLKSIDLVKNPDAETQTQLRRIHRASHHVIASNELSKGNYTEAIAEFKEAIEAEPYGEGYYRIALCLDNQKQIEEANLYYAMAELTGGEEKDRAKARLEALYKALHNNTLIGIDKVYTKAKDMMAQVGR